MEVTGRRACRWGSYRSVKGTVAHGDVPPVRRRIHVRCPLEWACVWNRHRDTFDHEIDGIPLDAQDTFRHGCEVLCLERALACAEVERRIILIGGDDRLRQHSPT